MIEFVAGIFIQTCVGNILNNALSGPAPEPLTEQAFVYFLELMKTSFSREVEDIIQFGFWQQNVKNIRER